LKHNSRERTSLENISFEDLITSDTRSEIRSDLKSDKSDEQTELWNNTFSNNLFLRKFMNFNLSNLNLFIRNEEIKELVRHHGIPMTLRGINLTYIFISFI
jgi:hypothetical protein